MLTIANVFLQAIYKSVFAERSALFLYTRSDHVLIDPSASIPETLSVLVVEESSDGVDWLCEEETEPKCDTLFIDHTGMSLVLLL